MPPLRTRGTDQFKARLRVEALEERVTPTMYTVTNNNDSGAGSLRDAVTQSNQSATTDTIVFQANLGPILLNSPIAIQKSLTITGNGTSGNGATVIDGQDIVKIFTVSPVIFGNSGNNFLTSPNVTFANLNLNNGRAAGAVSSATAGGGGAINITGGANTTVTLDTVLVSNCKSTTTLNGNSVGGGAIDVDGTLTVKNSTFFRDASDDSGGAIKLATAFNLTVMNSTFQANTSGKQGGAIAFASHAGISNIANSTFTQNDAKSGGAIALLGGDGLVRLENDTIAFNTVDGLTSGGTRLLGGGVSINLATGATLGAKLDSTIVSNNTDNNPGGSPSTTDLNGSFNVNSSFNFIGSARALTGLSNGVNGNQVGGNGSTAADPQLLPLAANGGPTLTFLLGNTSAARGAGANLLSLTTDQRGTGFPRVINGQADIGATENTPIPVPPTPPPPPNPNQPPPVPVALNPSARLAVGSGFGAPSSVVVYNSASVPIANLNPFPGFTGGVRVATGDVNGDGIEDIVCAAGPGGGPAVVVYDGATFQEISRFFAYDEAFPGGVYVAMGTVVRSSATDFRKDIITGAGAGGGPHVRAFNPLTTQILASYYVGSPTNTFGVSVAALDLDKDGIDEIVASNATGGTPVVNVLTALTGRVRLSFLAYDLGYTGGVSVGTGDLNGDGFKEIITGSASGSSHVKAFNLLTGQTIASFLAYAPNFTGGVQVGSLNVTGGTSDDIAVVSGPGSAGHLRVLDLGLNELSSQYAFDTGFLGGAFVG